LALYAIGGTVTEKEFKAVLSIDGYDLEVDKYEDTFWMARSVNKNTKETKYRIAGDTRADAIALLCTAHYANN
jgi:hypothetical protein